MKQVFHQAMTDLRAQRWPLAAWLLLLLACSLVAALKLDRFVVDQDAAVRLYLVLKLAGYLQLAFGWLIAVRIIQADPTGSTTAFWLTRPLSAGSLLVAKLIAIGALFLLLPNALAAAVAAAHRVGGVTLLQFSAERLTTDAALLLPVLAIAAATSGLARFALGAVVALLVAGAAVAATRLPFSWVMGSWEHSGVEVVSGRLAAVGALIAGSLGLLAHQYLTRRTSRTVAAGILAIVAIVGIDTLWPWSFWTPARFHVGPLDARLFDAGPVSVEFDVTTMRRADSSPDEIAVRGSYRVHGLPAGWVAHIERGRGELRLATAPAVPVASGNLATTYVRREAPGTIAGDVVSAFEHALGGRIVNAPQPRGSAEAWILRGSEAPLRQFRGAAANYTAAATLLVRRAKASPAMPLRPGASAAIENVDITIVSLDRWAIQIRETRPRLRFLLREPDLRLALRNGRRREAVLLTSHGRSAVPIGLGAGDMLLTRYRTGPVNGEGGEMAADPQWMADAELVALTLIPVGTFQRTVTIGGFELPQKKDDRN